MSGIKVRVLVVGAQHLDSSVSVMGSSNSTLRYVSAMISQAFPSEPTFSADKVPDLTGRIALVTGEHHPLS